MTITGPSWVYHRTEAPRLVHSLGEFNRLGPGWADSPAAFTDAPDLPPTFGHIDHVEPPPETIAAPAPAPTPTPAKRPKKTQGRPKRTAR